MEMNFLQIFKIIRYFLMILLTLSAFGNALKEKYGLAAVSMAAAFLLK